MDNMALFKIGQKLQRKEEAPTTFPATITIKSILPGTEVKYVSNPLGDWEHREPMDPSGTGPIIYIADNGERYKENELWDYYIH